MRPATAPASSTQVSSTMTTSATAPAMSRATRPRPADAGFAIARHEEDELIKLDLSDLALPKINDLQVDGLKASFWSRLFGK